MTTFISIEQECFSEDPHYDNGNNDANNGNEDCNFNDDENLNCDINVDEQCIDKNDFVENESQEGKCDEIDPSAPEMNCNQDGNTDLYNKNFRGKGKRGRGNNYRNNYSKNNNSNNKSQDITSFNHKNSNNYNNGNAENSGINIKSTNYNSNNKQQNNSAIKDYNNCSGNYNNKFSQNNNKSSQNNNKSSQNNNNNNKDNNKDNSYNKGKNNKNEGCDRGLFDVVKKYWHPIKILLVKKYEPLDSVFIKLHYRTTSLIFLFSFFFIWNKCFNTNQIFCIGIEAEKRYDEDVLANICKSYSYIGPQESKHLEDRQYQLFYRWVHFSFLILSGAFYLPRLVLKNFGSVRFKSLMNDLHMSANRYRVKDNKNLRNQILEYFEENLGTHSSTYNLFLFLNLLCTSISCLTILFLDFELQGRFFNLLFSFPFTKDPMNFQDLLSRTFPPFVNCTIDSATGMRNTRVDQLHCHLVLMEFYEKIFLIMLFLIQFLIIIGLVNIVLLLLAPILPCRKFLLGLSCQSRNVSKVQDVLIRKLVFGDIFVLWLIKSEISQPQFFSVLQGIQEILDREKTM